MTGRTRGGSGFGNPDIWLAPARQYFLYPVRLLVPSVRLHRLRDGLEDFEYLRAAMETGVDDRVLGPNTMAACRWERYVENLEPGKLEGVKSELLELRTALGRGITQAAGTK